MERESRNLPEQVEELRTRVRRLEEALARHGVPLPEQLEEQKEDRIAALPETLPAEALPTEAPPSQTSAWARTRTPMSTGGVPPASDERQSLESRIGSHWFNRIGILAVLVGAAWFLKLAIDNHWIGPLDRVVIGLAAGAAIVAWAERFRRQDYAGFGYSLEAVGSGILYLSLWAGYSLFHLFSAPLAFAAMILVTIFNGYMSWAREAEILAFYSIAGGMVTPLLLRNGGNHEIALFGYLLILDIAVLALEYFRLRRRPKTAVNAAVPSKNSRSRHLSAVHSKSENVVIEFRPWPRPLLGAFAGTAALFGAWWWEYSSPGQWERTALFLGGFFLIFAFGPSLLGGRAGASAGFPGNAAEPPPSSQLALALAPLPLANAALGFLGFYGLLSVEGHWPAAWLGVAFALFYLSLFLFVRRAAPAILPPLYLGAAVVFLALAVAIGAHGRWMTIGWLAEGAALVWAAGRLRLRLVGALGLGCLALGLVALIAIQPPAAATPFLNQRFAAFCVGIAVFGLIARIAATRREDRRPAAPVPWAAVGMAASLIVNALILLAVGWEIHSYWSRAGGAEPTHEARIAAQFTYSTFFMLFGGLLLGIGFWRRSAFLRWQALALLALTIAKVFVVDVSELSQGYRIVSFLGLGALLLAVSFLYQRDWLGLRSTSRKGS